MNIGPWTEFVLALLAFVGAHLILPIPPLRARLVALLGRRSYLFAYSTLSIALLVWVVIAARNAPYLPVWPQQPWQALVPLVLVPVAAWFLIAGLAEPNPLSISVRSDADSLGPMAAITRHPVLWAFLLWSASHLVPNGDLVSLTLFGGLTLLAAAGFGLVDRRTRRRLGETAWQALASRTSVIPFAAALAGRARLSWSHRLSLSVIAALALSVAFVLWGHFALTGTDPLAFVGFQGSAAFRLA